MKRNECNNESDFVQHALLLRQHCIKYFLICLSLLHKFCPFAGRKFVNGFKKTKKELPHLHTAVPE